MSGSALHGGVFDPEDPDRCFMVELMDTLSGKVVARTRADQPPLKLEIPDGHGFSFAFPEPWLLSQDEDRYIQFRVVETGELFPKEQRRIPADQLRARAPVSAGASAEKFRNWGERLNGLIRENTLIVGTHEMHRTGAPLITLEIIRQMKARHGTEVILLCLGRGGSLRTEFDQACVAVVDGLEVALQAAPKEGAEFFSTIAGALRIRTALVSSLCSTRLALACRQAGLDVVSLIHEYPYAFDHDWTRRHLDAASRVVLPCADVHRRFIEEGLLPRKPTTHTSILPQGCYLLSRAPLDQADARDFEEKFRRDNHLRNGDRLVFACGTLDHRKGFDWFANLIRHYREHSPRSSKVHFVWIGAVGNMDLFQHALHDMRREGVIGHFHHLTEMPDVRPALRLADVFLLCSRIDPFPSVVLEALSMGVPVVGFDRDQGCADLIAGTGFGRIIPARDLDAAVRAIDDLLGGCREALAVRASGAAYVTERFRFEDYVDLIAGHLLRGEALPPADLILQAVGTATEPTVPGARLGRPSLPDAVTVGLDFLASAQHSDGEFETLIDSQPSLETGRWDSSPFATALIAHSLGFCGPRATTMIRRALGFLESQMEPGGVWRYYTRRQFKHRRIPPDLDDTACAAFVLRRNGRSVPDNRWIFEALNDGNGRFHTWLVPSASSPESFGPYVAALEALAAERAPSRPPDEAGNPRFASPRDPIDTSEFDPVVNANVLLYLGEDERTRGTVAYLVDFLHHGPAENFSAYYADRSALHYMVARACDYGVPGLREAAGAVRERIEARFREDGPALAPIEIALEACALCTFAPDSPALDLALERLLDSQRPDGSWPRAAFYRGPAEFWGSEELTTGFCLEALQRLASARGLTAGVDPEGCRTETVPIDFEEPGNAHDPYPTYRFLREKHPVVFNEKTGTWLVSRHEDCVRVMGDSTTFSSRGTSFESTLTGADGEPHEKARKIMRLMFSSEHLAAIEPLLERRAKELLAPLRDRGACDFMKAVADPFPMMVVAHLLGVPQSSMDALRCWVNALLYTKEWASDEEMAPLRECRGFFREHVASLRRNPRGAPLEVILVPSPDGDQLDDDQIIDMCQLLMTAGFVTTTNLLGNAVVILASNPELRTQLRAEPGHLSSFIEEVLRFECPVQQIFRTTTTPVELGGRQIGAGESITLLIGSANRDEAKFPEADRFLLGRRPNPHLAFGSGGAHQCLGMHLARLEARVVLRQLLEQYPEFTPDWPHGSSPIRNHNVPRGPERLPIRFPRRPAASDPLP